MVYESEGREMSFASLLVTGFTFFATLVTSYLLFAPILGLDGKPVPEEDGRDVRRRELLLRRARVAEQLAELESDYLKGQVREDDFRAVQGDLLYRLEESEGALSALEGGESHVRRRGSGAL